MNSKLGLFIAKFGDKDYRFALSNSSSYVTAYPNQYFYDKKKSFETINEAVNEGTKLSQSMGVIINSVEFLGDIGKGVKDESDYFSGDIIQF